MTHVYVALIGGGVVLLVGLWLLRLARSSDEENYIVQKATPLPLGMVNVRDDVWLRGKAQCEAPLPAPHFGVRCLYYEYRLEQKEIELETDDKGRTRARTHWVTRHEEKRTAPFRLAQGELSIGIDAPRATFKPLQHKSAIKGDWRHTLEYLPYPAEISCVGSVSEDKEVLEPFGKIPLLVTPLDRDAYIKQAEREESILRFLGFLLFGLGALVFFYGLIDALSWPVDSEGKFSWRVVMCSAAGAGFLLLLGWSVYMYNTFVDYRRRVENAWRNIDPDLKMRHDLIPNLVEVVKAYLAHEKSSLENISRQRATAATSSRLLALVEAYPDLKANQAVERLFRELRALEEKIAHSRDFYNHTVKEYNDNVMIIPRGIIARLFGFKHYRYFELADDNE